MARNKSVDESVSTENVEKSVDESVSTENVEKSVDESVKMLKNVVVIGVKGKHLKEGEEYVVGGELAYVLLTKGVVKLK